MKRAKEADVSVYRVTAMLMIVLGHILNVYNIGVLTQFLITGVEMFLFMSGWLYGDYKIKAPWKWLLLRWRKICFPACIWSMIVCSMLVLICHTSISFEQIFISIMNFQGLTCLGIPVKGVPLAHLWFIIIIMICYILMMGTDFILENPLSKSKAVAIMISGGILVTILSYYALHFRYILYFFIGWFFKRAHIEFKNRAYIVLTVICILVTIIRLGSKLYIDGTILYDEIISQYNKIIIAIWIFYTFRYIHQKTSFMTKITEFKWFRVLESVNYYIYLTHYCFIVGDLSFWNIQSRSVYMNIFLFTMATGICTMVMYFLDNHILHVASVKLKSENSGS